MAIGTTLSISFDSRKVQRGLASMKAGIGKISLSLAKMGAAAATASLAAAAAGMIAFAVSSSKAAANIESLETQFSTLLKSTGAAKDRMEEITKFAANTPFEIKELAETSKLLQVMGGNLLATGEGLTLVGDAAAMAGQPLQEVGLHIGRVFQAITSGTSAGESVNRLQELGLISGTVKREFEELAKAQKKGEASTLSGAQALVKLQSVMRNAEGGMAALSQTTEGKLSNMKDNISQLQVAFGTGLNDGLKLGIDAINTGLPQLQTKFTLIGNMIGDAIGDSVAGDHEKFIAIGEYIGSVIGAAMKASFQSSSKGLFKFLAESAGKISLIPGSDKAGKAASDYIEKTVPGFRTFLDAALQEKGVREKGQALVDGVGSRTAAKLTPMGEAESVDVLKKTLARLEEIAKNTRTGSKL